MKEDIFLSEHHFIFVYLLIMWLLFVIVTGFIIFYLCNNLLYDR